VVEESERVPCTLAIQNVMEGGERELREKVERGERKWGF